MRTRILISGLIVVVAACSRPEPSMTLDEQRALDALPGGTMSRVPVASAIELPPPPEPAPVATAERHSAAPQQSAPVPERTVAEEIAPQPQPVPATAAATEDATHTVETPNVAAAPAPHAGHGGKNPEPANDDSGGFPDGRSGGPAIIIRGGGSGLDPCAIHRPMPAEPVVMQTPPPLINDRVPQVGRIPLGGREEPVVQPGRGGNVGNPTTMVGRGGVGATIGGRGAAGRGGMGGMTGRGGIRGR